ncbi:PIR protein, putative [Plasmodium sp. gorilla clade G1]|nr:PIR protein, putative [Plasmodium sp. gorilla clade G1]
MKMYYLKMLLFTFLINTLVLLHNENYLNNHYNVSLIQNNTKKTTINSRLLAQTKNHNPHYHNDPELKEKIDKMNEEAIKKYQQTHDPYKQLKEVVEKNGTKYTGGNDAEPMSTLEKELLETYKEVFGDEKDIILKSGMNPNDDDRSDKSSPCECTDINNAKLATTKGRDKYLKHLKGRCTRGICVCSVGTTFLTLIGLSLAKAAAFNYVTGYGAPYSTYASYISIFNMLNGESMIAAVKAGCATCSTGLSDLMPTAAGAAMSALYPWGIAALVLLILVVVLIILYIWLYKRRKNSWKHECKKHLCK